MKKYELVLGSGSPRRKDILNSLGVKFKVIVPQIEEKSTEEDAIKFCEDITLQKFNKLVSQIKNPNAIGICGDTIVKFENKIFGKPTNQKEAFETLTFLSGKTHEVVTSLCVGFLGGGKQIIGHSLTEVKFLNLSEHTINHYLTFNNFLDKAGSYAIQDVNCHFVSEIHGSYSNVIGLPIELLDVQLSKLLLNEMRQYNFNDWKKLFN